MTGAQEGELSCGSGAAVAGRLHQLRLDAVVERFEGVKVVHDGLC